MTTIKTVRCETVEALILQLQKMMYEKDLPVFGDTPIRQGMGDGCVIAVHQDDHDSCISIEEFDFDPEVAAIVKQRFHRATCSHCQRHIFIPKDAVHSDCMFVTCSGCKKCSCVDMVRTGDGYRVGDAHDFEPHVADIQGTETGAAA